MQWIFVSMLCFSFWLSCLPGLTHADNSDPMMVSALVKGASKASVVTKATLDPAAEAPVKNKNQKHQWSWRKKIIVTAGALIVVCAASCGMWMHRAQAIKVAKEQQDLAERLNAVKVKFFGRELSPIGLSPQTLTDHYGQDRLMQLYKTPRMIELLEFVAAYKNVGVKIKEMQHSSTLYEFMAEIEITKVVGGHQWVTDSTSEPCNLLDAVVLVIKNRQGDPMAPQTDDVAPARGIATQNATKKAAQKFCDDCNVSDLAQGFNPDQNMQVLKVQSYYAQQYNSTAISAAEELKETLFLKPIIQVIAMPAQEEAIMTKALAEFDSLTERSKTEFDTDIAQMLRSDKKVSELIFTTKKASTATKSS